ncbi:M23 family metallopeptidase [Pseudahrensia aquimaris]|uniref:M23 family metallopeptidase n=1 Tax=Pseudahrensia aquimaris TaxID=744461 RepID=A0ABW3FFC8_9HYPH
MLQNDRAENAKAAQTAQRLKIDRERFAARAAVDTVAARKMSEERVLASRIRTLQEHFLSHSQRQDLIKATMGKAKGIDGIAPVLADAMITGSISPAKTDANGLRLTTLAPSKALRGAMSDLPDIDELKTIAEDPTRYAETEEKLNESEDEQIAALKRARKKAGAKAQSIAKILKKRGISLPDSLEDSVGGPLIELKTGDRFLDTINALDETLASLSHMRTLADTLPHGSPVPGKKISSRYGARYDPFTGRRAVHGGLDFRAGTGTPVLATASGKITKAGRHGGYGKLVEIDHGNGMTTRYAHLSRIKVKIGQKIRRGVVIGKVGSTGRSTGPHLHYEVRRKGRTSDPLGFVKLAKQLKPLL